MLSLKKSSDLTHEITLCVVFYELCFSEYASIDVKTLNPKNSYSLFKECDFLAH